MRGCKHNKAINLGVSWVLAILLCSVGEVLLKCPCKEPADCSNVGICMPPPCTDGFLYRPKCYCCETCLRMNDTCDCRPDCSLIDCSKPVICSPDTVYYKHPCDCCSRCWPMSDEIESGDNTTITCNK